MFDKRVFILLRKVLILLLIMSLFLYAGIAFFNTFPEIKPICLILKNRIQQEIGNLNYCDTLNDCIKSGFDCKTFFLNKNARNFTLFLSYEKNNCFSRLLTCYGYVSPLPAIHDGKLAFIDCQERKCILNYTTNYSICKLFEDEDKRIKCYQEIAILTKNPEPCNKIENQTNKEYCIASVTIDIYNLSICEEGNDTRTIEKCYEKAALELISICDEVTESSLRGECYFKIMQKIPYSHSFICKKVLSIEDYEKLRGICKINPT